jgi:uncharacterized protein
MRRSWPRRVLWLASILALVYVCLSAVAGVILAQSALHLPRRGLNDRRFVDDARDNLGATVQDITMRARDGAELRAWYAVPEQENGAAVLLLHGMGDNRSGAAGYAKLFLTHGYRVVLPDSRAHGESGGSLTTYGVLERQDVRDWADWLEARPSAGCVYGFGESMGAGIVLQSLAAGAPFCAVVAESPFATFPAVATDRIAERFGSAEWLGRALARLPVEFAFAYTRWHYRIDLKSASPLDALVHSALPVLLIHGGADVNIRPWHSRALYDAAGSHVQLWVVPCAEHSGAWATAPAEFQSRVLGWFGSHSGRVAVSAR